MPAPLAKGLIIAASVLVAAGIAIYENPQVRQWVDQSRRKIAVALHSLGDDIQPRRASESSDDFEERKRRREELIRRNRNELIRRAREEGVAVDLDELARIGTEDAARAETRSRANRSKSFDELVGSDGMLRQDATTTGTPTPKDGLRKRGAAGFAAGTAAAAAMSNPFSDDAVLFDISGDDDNDEAPSPAPFIYEEPTSRSRSATLEAQTPPADPPVSAPLIDLTSEPQSVYLHPETHLPSPSSAPLDPLSAPEDPAQSFYSFTSSHHSEASADSFEEMSAGTLTPRSDRSGTTGLSMVPSNASDIAVLSDANTHFDDNLDARSEVFSESGFTDAGYSEYSLGDERAAGIMTPNSWTDVGSDGESEWEGGHGNGALSQTQQ